MFLASMHIDTTRRARAITNALRDGTLYGVAVWLALVWLR